MKIMKYSDFRDVFNETIFEHSKADLLEKISNYPSRYIGLFRPTKPKAKILQNLLQSHEIRFGNAFECIIEKYLALKGCKILDKRYTNSENKNLDIDQCFKKGNKVYFVEQKIRDDHDSSKIRGQLDNFEKKLDVLQSKFTNNKIVGLFYFIDPDLVKNKNFYERELLKLSDDYKVELRLFYGQGLFDFLGYTDIWKEILVHLKRWKTEIPDFPEINFDLDTENTFKEIKDLKPIVFRKILDNQNIFKEIILTLFPTQQTLRLLYDYFLTKDRAIYQSLAKKLADNIKLYN